MTKEPRKFKGERILYFDKVLGKLEIHMQSDEGGSYLTPYTQKIVSANWIIDVNIRAKTIKLLEVNIT